MTKSKDNLDFKDFGEKWSTLDKSKSQRIIKISDRNLLSEKKRAVNIMNKAGKNLQR